MWALFVTFAAPLLTLLLLIRGVFTLALNRDGAPR